MMNTHSIVGTDAKGGGGPSIILYGARGYIDMSTHVAIASASSEENYECLYMMLAVRRTMNAYI